MMEWMAPLRHLGAKVLVGEKQAADREPSMNEITTIGLDLAKHVFQIHGARQSVFATAADQRCQRQSATLEGDQCRSMGDWTAAPPAKPSRGGALANKTARIAWAVMHRQENYQRMATAA